MLKTPQPGAGSQSFGFDACERRWNNNESDNYGAKWQVGSIIGVCTPTALSIVGKKKITILLNIRS